jgi:hypothetical protein
MEMRFELTGTSPLILCKRDYYFRNRFGFHDFLRASLKKVNNL